jgi:hypothetical protein
VPCVKPPYVLHLSEFDDVVIIHVTIILNTSHHPEFFQTQYMKWNSFCHQPYAREGTYSVGPLRKIWFQSSAQWARMRQNLDKSQILSCSV